ncbi:DUF349 domain-containing protein [Buchananella hordeovulneris]|uniref:ATPase n=1 Tax=Buchananella hordeovulneris TaxID=52770 RepID=A0A1Q5PXV2_9ACTO|nr:DUF349 domain-containing protein [Buchananella hordeovulneris]OKL52448.1 ATPase [Buchananella hordeovulneris]
MNVDADARDEQATSAESPVESPAAPVAPVTDESASPVPPTADADPTEAGQPADATEALAESSAAPAPADGPVQQPEADASPSPAQLRPLRRTTPAIPAHLAEQPLDIAAVVRASQFGRVGDDGTVYVREKGGERAIGQYPEGVPADALELYVRRYLDIAAQVELFSARLMNISEREIDQTLASLTEALQAPKAVGDLDSLRDRLEQLRQAAEDHKVAERQRREQAKAEALAVRASIVERAEAIAAKDPAKTQWKQSGEALRALLDEWKQAQRSGPRIPKGEEDALWKRFAAARTAFDRHRRQYFSELDKAQAAAKALKEKLIARAEELSTSTEWRETSAKMRELMDEWKRAGRASRREDDALWARFRAAQQAFFDNRNSTNRAIDAEYAENLAVKEELLAHAEALLPITDPDAARAALRPIQDAWEEAGRVPREHKARIEDRMRAVERAVAEAENARWRDTDPEKKARRAGLVGQLEEAIEALEAELAHARAAGDSKAVAQAEEALAARRSWLDQIR